MFNAENPSPMGMGDCPSPIGWERDYPFAIMESFNARIIWEMWLRSKLLYGNLCKSI
jgi:hypothetical protein